MWIIISTRGVEYSFCQIIKTISVEFTREYIENNIKEIVKGKIYYQAPFKTVIEVKSPINQWMILENKEMIIHYPDDQKAFRIISSWNPFSMPFFEVFLAVIKEDYGLSELGYTMENYKTKGDTLISHWKPPENLSKFFGEFILEFKDNKITRIELKNPEGKTIRQTIFKNHILFGATYFPLEISTVIYEKKGRIFEKVIYKNPKFNLALPSEIINFKIPENVEIKEVKW